MDVMPMIPSLSWARRSGVGDREAAIVLFTDIGLKPHRAFVVHRAAREGCAVLLAEGLTAIRGERLVFRDVSFALHKGDALILTGRNGAGKSTLLRMLAGLALPEGGRVLWDGADALADRTEHGRRAAFLGHLDALKP